MRQLYARVAGRAAGAGGLVMSSFGVSPRLLLEGDNTLSLQAAGGEMDISLLDYVRLNMTARKP